MNGDVYVVDISSVFAGTGAVEVFDESRTFLREIAGEDTPAGSFAFSRIGTSGVTAHDGEAYVADTRNNVVDVFDSTGAYVRQLTGIVAPTGVAVDADGHLWVIRRRREFPLASPNRETILTPASPRQLPTR